MIALDVANPFTFSTLPGWIQRYELGRSVTNKWNRQYGDKKTLSEDTIWALIHRISLDNVRNVATKAKRRMAKVRLLNCHLWLESNMFLW